MCSRCCCCAAGWTRGPRRLLALVRAGDRCGYRLQVAIPIGAKGLKLAKTGHAVEEVVRAAITVAREAVAGTGTLVALDVGPLGELLEPMGTLTFERAYDLFREMMEAGPEQART